jgi:hypothetical protein
MIKMILRKPRIVDVSIGQGYLLIETIEKLGAEEFAQEILAKTTLGRVPVDVSGKYAKNTNLRKRIGQDILADTYFKIPLFWGSDYIIPGSSEHPSKKHKIYLVSGSGKNKFNNKDWNVLSKITEEELPRKLKTIYTKLTSIITPIIELYE